jgi:membrane peptidoglycan carboxypeptidase
MKFISHMMFFFKRRKNTGLKDDPGKRLSENRFFRFLTSRAFRISVILLVLAAGAGLLAAFIVLQYKIRQDPGKRFTREGIMKILARESAVFYSDGKTRVGTFFQDFHRDYVPYDSIPQILVDAVVSAEDKNFFSHGGIDYRAQVYAMFDNLRSFSVKRGGSTLTMQTAENLFAPFTYGLWNRLKAKPHEVVNTYRLEKNFSKQEILEFYLNQFYVVGNGRGVAIAARYFFNKNLQELDLREAAFIAGSVKGPNFYNPFFARTQEEKQERLRRSSVRTQYVLEQMHKNGKISDEDYEKTTQQELEFTRGKFRYQLSTNIVKVRKFLESPAMKKVMEEYGISNYMNAGLHIYTTLDKDLQGAVEYGTYKNLSTLDIIFNGYQTPDGEEMNIASSLSPGMFLMGRICSLRIKDRIPAAIQVEFGANKAWVTEKSLKNFLKLWNRYKTGRNRVPGKKSLVRFFKSHLRKDDLIYCSIPWQFEEKTDRGITLEIEKWPEIQGGTRIVKEGRILANVGGFDNTGYDRVDQAKRQFGSTFKPVVYTAALEMGWSPLDSLKNTRQLFRLGPTFYFPRPYHKPEPLVSMAWAGRLSENIASVYLLYHLMDKLNFTQFWQVCDSLGYAPKNFSDREEFISFVRDSLGLLINGPLAREIHYQKIVDELATDLIFEGRDREAEALKNLPYGRGFDKERKKYASRRTKEDRIRYEILSTHYLMFGKQLHAWEKTPNKYSLLRINKVTGKPGLFKRDPGTPWERVIGKGEPEEPDDVLIEGIIRAATIKAIRNKLREVKLKAPRYTMQNLFLSQEFKALISLQFVLRLSRKLGITNPLEPVLSFPLGSNVISLAEAVDVYQSIKDGYRYVSTETGEPQLFVEKIALSSGKIIFSDSLQKEQIISEKAKNGTSSILHNIVEGGTGARVKKEFKIASPDPGNSFSVSIPAYGKTGTTNDHRNGAFIGFISAPSNPRGDFSPEAGYTIGVYAGFDDNKKMEHKGFIGFGSTVSLNPWIHAAKSIAHYHDFSKRIDFYDLDIQITSKVTLENAEKYRNYTVNYHNGLKVNKNQDFKEKTTNFSVKW